MPWTGCFRFSLTKLYPIKFYSLLVRGILLLRKNKLANDLNDLWFIVNTHREINKQWIIYEHILTQRSQSHTNPPSSLNHILTQHKHTKSPPTFLKPSWGPSSRTSPRQQGDPTRQRDVLGTVGCPFSDGGGASCRTAGELGSSQGGTRHQAAVQAGTWEGRTFLPSGWDAGATLPNRCWYVLPKKKLNNVSCCLKKIPVIFYPVTYLLNLEIRILAKISINS